MPDTSDYSGAPVPLDHEANDPPGDFFRFRDAISHQLNLKASSTIDRNTRYQSAPRGTIVSCSTAPLVWMKTSSTANDWDELWSGADRVSASATWSSAVSGQSLSVKWRGDVYEARISCTYTGALREASASGNIPDVQICTLPAELQAPFRRTGRYYVAGGKTGDFTIDAGKVYLVTCMPGIDLEPDDGIELDWMGMRP